MIKDFVIINGVPILVGLQAETAEDLHYDNTKSQLQATNAQDAVDELNGKIKTVWHNLNSNTTFSAQTITTESLENFTHYEIIFRVSQGYNVFGSTGKMPVLSSTNIYTFNTYDKMRSVTNTSYTEFVFEDAIQYSSYGGNTVKIYNQLIPDTIIGYKI